jgi:uncharacterized protein YprB with RNaseH-like and TPR domain
LSREAGAVQCLPKDKGEAAMTEIRDKLRALLADKGLMTGLEWQHRREELTRRRAAGEFEIDKVVPGKLMSNEAGSFHLVRTDFPLDTRHGSIELGSVLEVIPEHVALSACDTKLEEFDPTTTVFLDTETTGLAGGTGMVAFLVGLGYFTEDVFRIEQCFMRDFDDEEPMLRYLEPLFRRFQTVVSYNGKAFDLPLLQTRCITNRLPFPLEGDLHLDLLHVARRFWKIRLKDCSLSNIERAVLGVTRHNDIPSEEIPQVWFDYLRSRDARPIQRVFSHHRFDILSLVGLTAWLSRCLEIPEGKGFEHAEDRLSLVRLHYRQRRYEEAVRAAQSVLEIEPEDGLRCHCIELMASAYKRLQEWERMTEAWNLLLRERPTDLLARLELAKYHEHHARNLPEAERICLEAIEFLETRASLHPDMESALWSLDAFRHRLERIRRKLSRAGGLEEL